MNIFKTKTIKHQEEQLLIQNIHNDFDSAQERLLLQAKEILSSIITNKIREENQIADRLLKIGFENVAVVKKTTSLKKLQEDEKEKVELIEYYKFNYPFLKFLTESELDKICTKYNLVYAPVKNYIEVVPEKNLVEIESAQELKKNDRANNIIIFQYAGSFNSNATTTQRKKMSEGIQIPRSLIPMYNNRIARVIFEIDYDICDYELIDRKFTEIDKQELFICAPKSHFNTNNLKKEKFGFFNFKTIEIKDPIVFRYVRGGVQVLSKWGLEASDEMLLNPINN